MKNTRTRVWKPSESRLEAVWKNEKHEDAWVEGIWQSGSRLGTRKAKGNLSGSRLKAVWKLPGSMKNTNLSGSRLEAISRLER